MKKYKNNAPSKNSNKKLINFIYLYMSVTECMYVYRSREGQKQTSDSLKLELKAAVSCYVGTGH